MMRRWAQLRREARVAGFFGCSLYTASEGIWSQMKKGRNASQYESSCTMKVAVVFK